MFSVKSLSEFSAWLNGLSDAALRGVVVARIKRLERGVSGGVKMHQNRRDKFEGAVEG